MSLGEKAAELTLIYHRAMNPTQDKRATEFALNPKNGSFLESLGTYDLSQKVGLFRQCERF